MIDLSVIVPVYNTQEYLAECVESLLNQNVDNYEIILVDDGSTDNSLQIIKQFALMNDNVTYIEKDNGGQGSARNVGISASKGKYIYFMDSDDVLEPNIFGYIMEQIRDNKLEAYFFDGNSFFDKKFSNKHNASPLLDQYSRKKSYGKYRYGEDLWVAMFENSEYSVSPCLYVVSKQTLIDNNLKFVEDIINEDQLFTTKLLLSAQQSMHEKLIFFKRRIRNNSTMTSNTTKKKVLAHEKIFLDLCKFYKQHKFLNLNNEKVFKKYLENIYLIYLVEAYKNNMIPRQKIISTARDYSFFSLKGILASLNIRLYMMLSNFKNGR